MITMAWSELQVDSDSGPRHGQWSEGFPVVSELGFVGDDPESTNTVFLGCSLAAGHSVSKSECWAYKVHKVQKVDDPTAKYVNLALCGSSAATAARHLYLYAQKFRAHRVVALLPPARRTELKYGDRTANYYPERKSLPSTNRIAEDYFAFESEHPENALHRVCFDLALLQQTAKAHDMRLYVYSWSPLFHQITQEFLGTRLNYFDWSLYPKGADGQHPGVAAHDAFANRVLKDIL